MGRGRAPCCDKSKVKKGPWSSAEDLRLVSFIQKHGHGNWRSLPKQAGLLRCGKSCRLRWINYLRPDLKRGNFTKEEEETIIKLHESLGNKWSKIASYFPGRTDNEIKNVWNTYLKKRLIKKDADADADANNHNYETKQFSRTSSSSSSSSSSSFMSPYGRQDTGQGPEDVDDQSCVSKRPHEYMKVLEKKQEILSTGGLGSNSSSISSHASNYSNSSLVDASMPKEEVGSLNNQSFNSDQVIEIPLESDIDDFWDLLDHLDPLQSNEYQPQEFEASQGSYDREIECRKWLRCLENELLGLEATSDGGYHHGHNPAKDAAPGQLDSEMMLSQEIDDGKGYFQKWSSPPKNFGI